MMLRRARPERAVNLVIILPPFGCVVRRHGRCRYCGDFAVGGTIGIRAERGNGAGVARRATSRHLGRVRMRRVVSSHARRTKRDHRRGETAMARLSSAAALVMALVMAQFTVP